MSLFPLKTIIFVSCVTDVKKKKKKRAKKASSVAELN